MRESFSKQGSTIHIGAIGSMDAIGAIRVAAIRVAAILVQTAASQRQSLHLSL